MDAREVVDVLRRLAELGTSAEEAERLMERLDGAEVDALPTVFSWLHDATNDGDLHAAVRLLGRWRAHPLAAALRPALRALLRESGVPDLNKLAAAGLLEVLDDPVDVATLVGSLADPATVAHDAIEVALEASREPFARINLIDTLVRQPLPLVLDLIDDLTERGDARAAALLGPLTVSALPEVAIAAIAAIDMLGLSATADLVGLVAEHAADPSLRREAARTLARLPAPPGGRAAPGLLLGAYVTGDGRNGSDGLVVLVSASAVDPESLDVLAISATAEEGVRQHVTAELVSPDELRGFVERFAEAGIPPAPAPFAEVRRRLTDATARTLSTGGAEAPGFAVWTALVGSPESS